MEWRKENAQRGDRDQEGMIFEARDALVSG
jgi:hypothetical protein